MPLLEVAKSPTVTYALIGCFAFYLMLAQTTIASSAEVLGNIDDADGKAVSGVALSFKNAKGNIVATTRSAKDGSYDVAGLKEGSYSVKLDPAKTGYRESEVALAVNPDDVLCVNWSVSTTAQALATASRSPAVGPLSSPSLAAAACRYDSPAELELVGSTGAVAVVGGIAAGACAAAGCFNSANNSKIEVRLPKKSIRRLGD